MDDEKVLLTDEDGNEEAFEFLEMIQHEGMEYVVLTPASEDNEDDEDSEELELVILRVVYDQEAPGGSLLATEENEEIVEAVFEIFQQHYEAAYDDEE